MRTPPARSGRRWSASLLLDRLAKFSTLLIAIIAGAWSVFQYIQQLERERLRTGFELNRQYVATFGPGGVSALLPLLNDPAAMRAIALKAKCRVLVAAGSMAAPPPDCAALDAGTAAAVVAAALTANQRRDLRDALEQAQLEAPWTSEELDAIQSLAGFYHAVAICIQGDMCDGPLTLALFEAQLVPFLNGTCGLLGQDEISRSQALAIARMVHDIQGAAPPGYATSSTREEQFLCNWLRL